MICEECTVIGGDGKLFVNSYIFNTCFCNRFIAATQMFLFFWQKFLDVQVFNIEMLYLDSSYIWTDVKFILMNAKSVHYEL